METKYQMMCLKAQDLWDGRLFELGDLMLIAHSEDAYYPFSRDYPDCRFTESIDGIHVVSNEPFIKRTHTYENPPPNFDDSFKVDYLDFFDAMICMGGTIAWIPTSEQLERELKNVEKIREELAKHFKTITSTPIEFNVTTIPFDSVEEILLNRLMYEKFGKVWNGEEWKTEYEDLNPLIIKANHKEAWDKVREKLILREKNRCVICQDSFDNGKLHIHHKNGNALDNRLENLLLVCPPCHRRLHKIIFEKSKRTEDVERIVG